MEYNPSHYHIHKQTMALVPVAHPTFHTMVIEPNEHIWLEQTPQQILKQSCMRYGATYEGIRTAIMSVTGFKRMVPILISPMHRLCAFPTHSPSHFACNWIFCEHILAITQFHDPDYPDKQTMIMFYNGEQILSDVSVHTLDKQFRRGIEIIGVFK